MEVGGCGYWVPAKCCSKDSKQCLRQVHRFSVIKLSRGRHFQSHFGAIWDPGSCAVSCFCFPRTFRVEEERHQHFFFSIKLDSLLLPQVFFTVSWQQHIHFNMALFLRQGLPKCLLISEGKLILQEGINSSPHFPPI